VTCASQRRASQAGSLPSLNPTFFSPLNDTNLCHFVAAMRRLSWPLSRFRFLPQDLAFVAELGANQRRGFLPAITAKAAFEAVSLKSVRRCATNVPEKAKPLPLF
jgi:hypothetical protein